MKEDIPTFTLPYVIPDLSKAVGFSAGQRPYRQGGIRLEKVNLEGKTIYHDYGHGGGGLSLAYGCAEHVVNTLFLPQNVPLSEPLAVFGAGIIGLTTAHLLIERGYTVTVYAELIPFERAKDKPEITTTVAAAYWMPLKLGNKEQTQAFAISTWNHYKSIMKLQEKTGKNLGVTILPTFCVNDDEGLTNFPIKGVIAPKDCMVTFGDRIYYKAKTFPSMVIESRQYIPYLMQLMQKSGRFQLVREQLVSRQDALRKKENHIFNCMGLGSKMIFEDAHLNKGIKGHVVRFKLDQHASVKDFILFMKTTEGRWVLQVPQQQSGILALGISYEQDKPNSFPQTVQVRKIVDTARNFFLQVEANQVTPKL